MSIGSWLSAALDDPNVCAEMKADIEAWFKGGEPGPEAAQHIGADDLAAALSDAVEKYGKPGGPWNVPSEPGSWIAKARAALAKYRTLTDERQSTP